MCTRLKLSPMLGPQAPPLNSVWSPPKALVKFILIHHLSYPHGDSVNDTIDPAICSVKYASFSAVVDKIRALGQAALIANFEIKYAFRLLPIHLDDFNLWAFTFSSSILRLCLSSAQPLIISALSLNHTWRVRPLATIWHTIWMMFCFLVWRAGVIMLSKWNLLVNWGYSGSRKKLRANLECLLFWALHSMSRLPQAKVQCLLKMVITFQYRSKITLKEFQVFRPGTPKFCMQGAGFRLSFL